MKGLARCKHVPTRSAPLFSLKRRCQLRVACVASPPCYPSGPSAGPSVAAQEIIEQYSEEELAVVMRTVRSAVMSHFGGISVHQVTLLSPGSVKVAPPHTTPPIFSPLTPPPLAENFEW
jgi:hypothetical protein